MSRATKPLKRRLGNREPKRKFYILCEGRNTEPTYFDALKRICRDALIHIEIEGGVGVPLTLADKAVAKARSLGISGGRRKKRDSFELNDEVWICFDCDEHPRISDAIQKCDGSGVKVAYSNPCFEIWLIIHLCDFNRPDTRDQVQNFLGQLCPEYQKKSGKVVDCDKIIETISDAEMRGVALVKRREEEGNPLGRPCSTVWRLTTAIRQAAQDFKK